MNEFTKFYEPFESPFLLYLSDTLSGKLEICLIQTNKTSKKGGENNVASTG